MDFPFTKLWRIKQFACVYVLRLTALCVFCEVLWHIAFLFEGEKSALFELALIHSVAEMGCISPAVSGGFSGNQFSSDCSVF